MAESESDGAIEVEGPIREAFAVADSDRDGYVSFPEFSQISFMVGKVPDHTYASTFMQADIDDDERLSMQELQFARYLMNEGKYSDLEDMVMHHVPPGLLEGIDGLMVDFRRSFKGPIEIDGVVDTFEVFLQDYGIAFDDEMILKLVHLFNFADVTRDSKLNLNELDFFHFLVREAVIEGALGRALHAFEAEEKKKEAAGSMFQTASTRKTSDLKAKWREFFKKIDRNGDGKVDPYEAVLQMPEELMETDTERFVMAAYIEKYFPEADANHDGTLDPEELSSLAHLILTGRL